MVQGFKMRNLVDEYKTIFLGKRSKQYWIKALKCKIRLMNTKPFFWETDANLETLQKRSPYIWLAHKFVWKPVKNLNWIFWATDYWFKALKCQIWLTNTKPFIWKTETNLETLQKISPYISVSCKLVLKSVNSLNPNYWATKCCLKALKWRIWLMNRKPFYWESEAKLETLPKLSSYIWVSY